MMNKKIFVIVILGIFLFSSFNAVGISINQYNDGETIDSSYQLQTSSTTINIGKVTIGENYIEFEDIEDITIWTDSEETLIITAEVYFRLYGFCDHGYAYLGFWDQNYVASDHDGEDRDSNLSFTIDNAKPGDVFEIEFKAVYEDCINDDFSERKKIIITIKEEVEDITPDLWPIETWISSEENDWAKEHVIKKIIVGEKLYVHLRYNILYTKDKRIPTYHNAVRIRLTPSIILNYEGLIRAASTVGTGEAKEERNCFSIPGSVFEHVSICYIEVYLDNFPIFGQGGISESNENNNAIYMTFSVRPKSKSTIFESLLPDIFDNFPLLKQIFLS